MNIKVKLTAQLLCSMIIVLCATFVIYIMLNVLIFKNKLSFSDDLFNISFNSRKFVQSYVDDLEKDSTLNLDKDKEEILIKNNIWIQLLNENNEEIYSFNKPENVPKAYSAYELISFIDSPWESVVPTTAEVGEATINGENCTLIVGYPINKVRYVSIWISEESLKYHGFIILLAIVMMTFITYLFTRGIVKPMVSVVNDIDDLKNGIYLPKAKKQGVYKEVSENINDLAKVLKENETERQEIEKAKEQWIANISHDLKTPLSSIKGYAELLEDDSYEIDLGDAKRYAHIILRNSNYIQELVDDLSLIYKLKNKVVPFKFQEENIVSVIQEIVIDLLNNSRYEGREINLNYGKEKIPFKCDKKYFKRAIYNFLINSLEHNLKDTIIDVEILEKTDGILITIEDNGQGINNDDLKNIFKRYYRGANKSSADNGSGLGMAIAKEVIDGHNGRIDIESEIGKGTIIKIMLKK